MTPPQTHQACCARHEIRTSQSSSRRRSCRVPTAPPCPSGPFPPRARGPPAAAAQRPPRSTPCARTEPGQVKDPRDIHRRKLVTGRGAVDTGRRRPPGRRAGARRPGGRPAAAGPQSPDLEIQTGTAPSKARRPSCGQGSQKGRRERGRRDVVRGADSSATADNRQRHFRPGSSDSAERRAPAQRGAGARASEALFLSPRPLHDRSRALRTAQRRRIRTIAAAGRSRTGKREVYGNKSRPAHCANLPENERAQIIVGPTVLRGTHSRISSCSPLRPWNPPHPLHPHTFPTICLRHRTGMYGVARHTALRGRVGQQGRGCTPWK